MAESIKKVYNVCDAQHITKPAVHWCPECEEGFCKDCLKHHNASKYTRSHEVISIENYMLILPYVDKVIQYCTDHGNKYQVYCSEHECLCCTDCLSTTHDKCAGILSIDKLVKNAKSSTLLNDIERGIRDIRFNLDRISEEKRKNISRITTQRQKICDEIKSFRNKINHKLDIMENEIMNDLDAKEKTIKLEIETLLSKLNKKSAEMQNFHDTIHVIKYHGTDLQTFFVSKSLVKNVATEEINVKSLFDGNALQQYELSLVIDDHVSKFVSSVKSLGTITCSESSTTVTFYTEKERGAQVLTQVRENSSKSIDEIRPNLILAFPMSKYQSNAPTITGCSVNTDGKIIIADYRNRCLVVLNHNGKVESEISTKPSSPWDVTYIDVNRVAVTCNSPTKILVVNITSKRKDKTIVRNNLCTGIDNIGDTLFYYSSVSSNLIYYKNEIGLQTFNLSTFASRVVVKDETDSWFERYVAVLGKRIYLTKYENDLVLCYSDTGNKIWEYCNTKILIGPRGVALDKYSNVYVASYDNKCVVVISADGKKARKLITLQNEIYAIHIDKNDRLLAVDRYGNAKAALNLTYKNV